MTSEVSKLIDQIRDLEKKIEAELVAQRAAVNYQLNEKKAIFEKEICDQHKKLKIGTLKFLRTSPLLTLLTAPFTYAMVVPLAPLDISLIVYQWICFSAWGLTCDPSSLQF